MAVSRQGERQRRSIRTHAVRRPAHEPEGALRERRHAGVPPVLVAQWSETPARRSARARPRARAASHGSRCARAAAARAARIGCCGRRSRVAVSSSCAVRAVTATRLRASRLDPAVAALFELQRQLLAAGLARCGRRPARGRVGHDVVEQPLVVGDDDDGALGAAQRVRRRRRRSAARRCRGPSRSRRGSRASAPAPPSAGSRCASSRRRRSLRSPSGFRALDPSPSASSCSCTRRGSPWRRAPARRGACGWR